MAFRVWGGFSKLWLHSFFGGVGGGGVTLKEDYTLLRSILGSPILGNYRLGVAATVPTGMPRHSKGYLIRLGDFFLDDL